VSQATEAQPRDPDAARRLGKVVFALAVCLLAASILGIVGIALGKRHSRREQAAAKSREVDRGPVVLVARAEPGKPHREVTLTADVRGFFQTTVYAKVSGYVREVRVDKGDRVQEGQILGVIWSPETDQALEAAEANASLQQKLARRAQLLSPNLVAIQEAETARSNQQVSTANVASARAVKQYEVLRAPFDGVVTARYVDPGALMPSATGGTQSAMPFVDVGVTDTLRIDGYVGQDVASFVHEGDPTEVWQDERPDVRVHTAVTRTSGALDPRTRTMLVEVQLDNRAYGFLPGTFANLTLKVDAPSSPTVPAEALVVRNGKNLVAKIEHDRVRLVPIDPGRTNGSTLEIRSGVAPGDVVALDLPVELPDGAAVQPVEKKQESGDGGAPGGR
jgi:membrane fusion protein, multidrug efflux system